MNHVIGIGGIFFKANDPERLYQWYEKHLGLQRDPNAGAVIIPWPSPEQKGVTVFSIVPANTKYFNPSPAPFMLNLCVNDLDGLLKKLEAAGAEIDPKREDYDYGRFAWIMDPEGNRIELWEPK